MSAATIPVKPTRLVREAIFAECNTCGHKFLEYSAPWPMSKSIGMHARNGQCGGPKAITMYKFAEVK